MSKRTTSTSKPSDVPAANGRTKPAADAIPPTVQSKAPRARRTTAAPADAAMAADLGVTMIGASRQPTHDEIATRAYYIAQSRDFKSDPLSDWLAAERELAQA